MSLTGHAAVIGAWQLLERDDLGHRRHLQVTLCLLGRDDPGHRMTSLGRRRISWRVVRPVAILYATMYSHSFI